jgi:hypothetical protein
MAAVLVIAVGLASGAHAQSGSLSVVDSSDPPIRVGALDQIGPKGEQSFVLMTAANDDTTWWMLSIDASGFRPPAVDSPELIMYQDASCSTAPYFQRLDEGATRLVIRGVVSGDQVLYAGEPRQKLSFSSQSVVPGGQCEGGFTTTSFVGPLLRRPLSDFTVRPEGTLTPPFAVSRQ